MLCRVDEALELVKELARCHGAMQVLFCLLMQIKSWTPALLLRFERKDCKHPAQVAALAGAACEA